MMKINYHMTRADTSALIEKKKAVIKLRLRMGKLHENL